jgi:hypothetical protein
MQEIGDLSGKIHQTMENETKTRENAKSKPDLKNIDESDFLLDDLREEFLESTELEKTKSLPSVKEEEEDDIIDFDDSELFPGYSFNRSDSAATLSRDVDAHSKDHRVARPAKIISRPASRGSYWSVA